MISITLFHVIFYIFISNDQYQSYPAGKPEHVLSDNCLIICTIIIIIPIKINGTDGFGLFLQCGHMMRLIPFVHHCLCNTAQFPRTLAAD
jgi:hypothetical protein